MKRALTLCTALLLSTTSPLHAAETVTQGASQTPPLRLALDPLWLADATPTPSPATAPPAEQDAPFKGAGFTANKLHQYLGIGSIALATLAVLSPKDEDGDEGAHHSLGVGAAALGAAAVTSGLIIHWDDLSLSGGFSDPDNQHAFFATLGAIGYALAVSQAPEESHAALGASGFVAMAIGIRLTW